MTFQEYPTIFQFSRTFQGPCEPWFPSFEWHWTHILTGLDLWNVQTVQLYSWDILTALFSVLCILTKQHGVRSGKYLLKTSGNTISETLIFKMSLQYMPRPSRTCAFGASYKATYYSLSVATLKLFDSPVCWIVICPRDNAIQCLNKQGLGEEKVEQNFPSKETIQY